MKTKTITDALDEAAEAPPASPARRPATDEDGLPQGAPDRQSYESKGTATL